MSHIAPPLFDIPTKGQLHGCISFDTIVGAVAAAALSADASIPISTDPPINGKLAHPDDNSERRGSFAFKDEPGSQSPWSGPSKSDKKYGNSPALHRQRRTRPKSTAGDNKNGKNSSDASLVPHAPETPLFSTISARSRSSLAMSHPVASTPTEKPVVCRVNGSERRAVVDMNFSTAGNHGVCQTNARDNIYKKTTDPITDLRRRYRSSSLMTSQASTKSTCKRSGGSTGGCSAKEAVALQVGSRSDKKQPRGGEGEGERGTWRRECSVIIRETVEREAAGAKMGADTRNEAITRIEERPDRGCRGGGDMPGAALRSRYDRELLRILEEEQAAEDARERVLAAAKAKVRVTQARAGDAATSHSKLLDKTEQSRNSVSNTAKIDRGGGSTESKKQPELSSSLVTRAAVADEARTEADAAVRKAKQLEEHLTRERRAASERVMRVAEAYEEALRSLSTARPYNFSAAHNTVSRPLEACNAAAVL